MAAAGSGGGGGAVEVTLEVSRGLQLHSLWIVPAAAVG